MPLLEKLHFDNLALRTLPLDAITSNYVRTVNNACFSRVQPTPLKNPRLVCHSSSALALLGLSKEEVKRPEFAQYFSGNKILPGSEPASHCYCGHQFGYFAGQLGDGAAIYLGEVINKDGERWEIQLKGAGLTPYSRQADGRKVLRSSIREFLCSEAMHYLGIPTTRAGSIITSDTKVIRDMFYDNHPKEENCAVVLRIAPSFLRFGSFEIFKTLDPATGRVGPSCGRKDIFNTLLDYSIKTFYPEIYEKSDKTEERCFGFFKEVVIRTARLVAQWQAFGFCHGVLNTDNMSILGLTLDYGPFGFLDFYNPDHISNTSDDGGRYSFNRQPEMCHWNLQKFAEVLGPALPTARAQEALELFGKEFEDYYHNLMKKKLGLFTDEDEDNVLVQELLATMASTGADYTNCMRLLSFLTLPGSESHQESRSSLLESLCNQCMDLADLQRLYGSGMADGQLSFMMTLLAANPEVMTALGKGNNSILQREVKKMESAKRLKDLSPETKLKENQELWSKWLDAYCRRLESETVGASSLQALQDQRRQIMNAHNPKFILRNYIAQEAIEKAEAGDFSFVQQVLKKLKHPFEESTEQGKGASSKLSEEIPSSSTCPHYGKTPSKALDVKLSCSS